MACVPISEDNSQELVLSYHTHAMGPGDLGIKLRLSGNEHLYQPSHLGSPTVLRFIKSACVWDLGISTAQHLKASDLAKGSGVLANRAQNKSAPLHDSKNKKRSMLT